MNKFAVIRTLGVLLCLLSAGWCAAQQPSRVVFFRMDAEPDETYNALADSQLHTDALKRGDETIARMRAGSAFVYTPYGAAGLYRLTPYSSGPGHSNTLELPELRGEIAFVNISLSSTTPISARLKAVSYADFGKHYEKSHLLRKHLGDAGYLSLAALTNGFRPVVPSGSAGPDPRTTRRNTGDTLYFDIDDRHSLAEAASYFSTATDSGSRFLIRDYFLPSRRLRSEYIWTTLDSESRDGQSRTFFRNGQLASRGSFRANRKHGAWEYYRDTLPDPLWYTCSYKHGLLDGMLTSYYPSGSIKRKELHRALRGDGYPAAADDAEALLDGRDSIISGQCFDESGREIPFTPFEKMPVPGYSLSDWLSRTLRYPKVARRRGTEGRTIVQFVVNSQGEVEQAKIVRSVDEYLDAEALRVINAMPNWRPGRQDDVPINVYFTLPITFKLD